MDFFIDADYPCKRKGGGGSKFRAGHVRPFYTAGLVRIDESWELRGRDGSDSMRLCFFDF
jgi:hypothetical protein